MVVYCCTVQLLILTVLWCVHATENDRNWLNQSLMPGQSVTLDDPWKQRNWNKSVLYLQATIVTPLEMGKHFIPPPQKSESTDTSEGDVTTLSNQTDKIIDEEEFVDNGDDDDDDVDDDDDDNESLQILDFRGGNILTATSVDSFDAADLLQNDMEFNDAPPSKSGKKKRILAGKKLKTSDRTNDTDYSNEYRIKKQLLSNYDKSTRPVRNDTTPITLFIGMSLYHILDTNEKFQTLSALIAVRLRWTDEYLRWNASKFEGIDTIWVPATSIWTPDIFINNFADDSFKDFMNTYTIVSSSGHVLWMFPAIVKVYCTLDVQHFPFDNQRCKIVFISWTFHGLKLNVTYNVSEPQAIYYTPKNQEWFVDRVTVERNEKIYACCPEPYPDVTFAIHMTRRSLFYVVNLIFPCLLIYAVSFLGFFLPIESGEKVNLEITILLALVVFLLIVGETLPPTPDAIPALGLLFGLTMIMVSIALVMAVVVTNIFLRKDTKKRVPVYIRKIFLRNRDPLAHPTLRLQPSATMSTGSVVHPSSFATISASDNHLETSQRSEGFDMDSLSILSEMENKPPPAPIKVSPSPIKVTFPPRSGSELNRSSSFRHNLSISRKRRSSKTPTNRYPPREGDTTADQDPAPSDQELLISLEWQDLAKIVDRIFFWLFLLSSVGSLTGMFMRIPP